MTARRGFSPAKADAAWHGSTLIGLVCSACRREFKADELATFCQACTRPLLARYDLETAARTLTPASAAARHPGLTRWSEVLPFASPAPSLGEGNAPLLRAPRLDRLLGLAEVWVLDESVNPTGSFKALGLAVAVNRAADLGAEGVALPTAGNAGMALAAYAALRGLGAVVVCPEDTPLPSVAAARGLGAHVELLPGLIDACGARVTEICRENGYFNCSTLKEPYRVEGKKTMGYELVLKLGRTPDSIVYPTGGGTGILGFAKAFDEMSRMGWIEPPFARLVSVQADGCAPIVRAFEAGALEAEPWRDAATLASGLRVPGTIGDRLILDALRSTNGTARRVSDDAMMRGATVLSSGSGALAAPEGGACLAAARELASEGFFRSGETVVLVNTGTLLSYVRPGDAA